MASHDVKVTLKEFVKGRWIFFAHIAGLFLPGLNPPVHSTHPVVPDRSLTDWDGDDLTLLIEEGRRHLDRQLTELKDVRARAQLLLTIGLAVGAFYGAQFKYLTQPRSTLLAVPWTVGFICLSVAVLAAAAILTVSASMTVIDAAVLSTVDPPIRRYLAGAYAGMLIEGSNTVSTKITIFREAILWLLASGLTLFFVVVLR